MKHPLAIDLMDLIDDLPAEHRSMLAHIVACEPCRRSTTNLIQSSDKYPDLFARQDESNDGPGASLFLALFVPDANPERDDPDDLADDIARTLNGSGAPPYGERVMVGAIPAPQWLTPETLANLREQASPRPMTDECACWIDDDPINGFDDARDCPLHGDDDGSVEAYEWWRSQQ